MDDKVWLKEAINKLDSKVDKLDQQISDMKVLHAKNTASLSEHILRTEINEENIAMLREEFKPVQNHTIVVNAVLKGIGIVSTLVGIGTGLLKLLDFFKL